MGFSCFSFFWVGWLVIQLDKIVIWLFFCLVFLGSFFPGFFFFFFFGFFWVPWVWVKILCKNGCCVGWLLGTTLMWLKLFCGLWNLMLVAGFEFGPLKFDDTSKKYYCSSLMVWAEKIKFDSIKYIFCITSTYIFLQYFLNHNFHIIINNNTKTSTKPAWLFEQ